MSSTREYIVVGLGELLWDQFPGGNRLGGAPANFAVMASRLGAHGIVASRVGMDPAGRKAREELAASPLDIAFLQEDPSLPTGSVSVTIRDGQPEYRIHAPVAWDALVWTPEWEQLARRADAVCWGTLAQRDNHSRETIARFLAATTPACLRVFDINLRPPFPHAEVVTASLACATLLKLNDAEMPHLLALGGLPNSDGAPSPEILTEDARRVLAAYPNLQLIAVTLGANGSLLVIRDEAVRHGGVATEVIDTVGAGDAFTAALTVYRLQGASLAVQSEAANRWGAWVASQPGAMPPLSEKIRSTVEHAIAQTAGASSIHQT